jgi:formylmethanofuran dehydrogenase subunit B
VESGEADCLLWISAYGAEAPAWNGSAPTIALTAEDTNFRRPPRVRVTVGRPGVDHEAVDYRPAAGALAFTAAPTPREVVRVCDALAAIAAALPAAGAPPC